MTTITISKSNNSNCRQIKINGDWFEGSEFFSIEETEEYLHITKHYLEVPEKARKTKRGYFHMISEAPLGKYEICKEESNEDEIIIYFDKEL